MCNRMFETNICLKMLSMLTACLVLGGQGLLDFLPGRIYLFLVSCPLASPRLNRSRFACKASDLFSPQLSLESHLSPSSSIYLPLPLFSLSLSRSLHLFLSPYPPLSGIERRWSTS